MRYIMALCLLFLFIPAAGAAEGPILKRLQSHFAESPARAGQAGLPQAAATMEIAGLQVAYWLPQDRDETLPLPLVIFSHGFGGCKTQSAFLMTALAAHGYAVVAPDHQDAGCGDHGVRRPESSFRKESGWSADTYKDRHDDIVRLYGALKKDKTWHDRIDWDHVGLAGHSLGGYTVLGLAGGWPSWKMEGIRAVLALSPYSAPFADHGALGDIGVPVMYQGGTRDLGITPGVKRPGGAFDQTPKAVFVEFDKTGHFGWTDLQKGAQENIVRYSLWFFDKTLKGIDAPLEKAEGVTDLRVNGKK